MAVGVPFAHILSAHRAHFNARVTEARRRYPAFDTAAFAEFLQTGVAPVVEAVAHAAPERTMAAGLAAYALALELVGQSLAGPNARHALVDRLWREVLPVYGHIVAGHPDEVPAMLTNAVLHLSKVNEAGPASWLQAMQALAPAVETLAQLRALGQVLSWRCGLAHFRAGAIRAADGLPEPLALTALGCAAPLTWSQAKEHLLTDHWWAPPADAASDRGGLEFGRFTGFGGPFAEPPLVRACTDGFVVKSAQRYSLLVADAFGAVLHPATEEEFMHAPVHPIDDAVALEGSRLTIGARMIELDLPAGQISVTQNAHTVAVTSPVSHAIRLLPLQ